MCTTVQYLCWDKLYFLLLFSRPNADDDHYSQLLELAKKRQTTEFLQLIRSYKFDPSFFHNPDGILVYVAQSGSAECLEELVKMGVDINKYKCEGDSCQQPLFLVNVLKNPACVEIILEHGAEVNALNKVDRNALHVAIIDKAPIATVELLLKSGVDVNQKDTHGSTSLLYASTTTTDCVRLLLEHGADTNLPNKLGQSPLMLSIRPPNRKRTHCDIPKLLLNAGADVNAKDKFQRSPLHYSSSYKNADVAALFIDHGANINCADESNQTPLMFSIFYTDDRDSDACHRVLLEHDCDIHIIDTRGNSALHHAARCGRAQLLEELCQRGADINLKSEKGFTPLISSIQEGKINCMKILLRFGSELKSLQRHSNEIHQSIMQHGMRQNNTARMKTMYTLLLVAGLRINSQLPCDVQCQETKRMNSVPSLMHCSRVVVRQKLAKHNQHTNLFISVENLPLPQRIKNSLLYNVDLTITDERESDFNVRSVIQLA